MAPAAFVKYFAGDEADLTRHGIAWLDVVRPALSSALAVMRKRKAPGLARLERAVAELDEA